MVDAVANVAAIQIQQPSLMRIVTVCPRFSDSLRRSVCVRNRVASPPLLELHNPKGSTWIGSEAASPINRR
jgi:hypothetical protein